MALPNIESQGLVHNGLLLEEEGQGVIRADCSKRLILLKGIAKRVWMYDPVIFWIFVSGDNVCVSCHISPSGSHPRDGCLVCVSIILSIAKP